MYRYIPPAPLETIPSGVALRPASMGIQHGGVQWEGGAVDGGSIILLYIKLVHNIV